MNSEAILILWLTTPGNYSRYRGGNKKNGGKGKIQYAEEIARKINAAGVRVKRDAVKVKSKIEHIESCFRSAHDFAFTETGAGLKEKDDATDFNEAVLKKCPWYFDLLPIFQDRASAKPKMTSDELDLSDSDEEDGRDEDDCGDDDDGDEYGDDDDGGGSSAGSVHSIEDSSSPEPVPITPSLPFSGKKLGTGTKRFSAGGSSRPLSVKKKSKGDDDVFVGGKGGDLKTLMAEANEHYKTKRFEEVVRHNKVLEDTAKWKARNDEVEYKKNLLEYKFILLKRYREMKDEMKMSKTQIFKQFPEMKEVVDEDDHNDDDDSDVY
jgi:hypothetical protein